MVKRITVSVPDELHEKMETWKNSFNYSKVFQEAISSAIQKKVEFKNRLKEKTTMEQVIERLKQEKTESNKDWFDQGKLDALDWAKAASYEDLLYAINWEPMNSIGATVSSYDPTQDENLGGYFQDILEIEYKDVMRMIETGNYNYIPNDIFAAWEEGWVEGVSEFWGEIKNKI
jgi:hypothetical protein